MDYSTIFYDFLKMSKIFEILKWNGGKTIIQIKPELNSSIGSSAKSTSSGQDLKIKTHSITYTISMPLKQSMYTHAWSNKWEPTIHTRRQYSAYNKASNTTQWNGAFHLWHGKHTSYFNAHASIVKRIMANGLDK